MEVRYISATKCLKEFHSKKPAASWKIKNIFRPRPHLWCTVYTSQTVATRKVWLPIASIVDDVAEHQIASNCPVALATSPHGIIGMGWHHWHGWWDSVTILTGWLAIRAICATRAARVLKSSVQLGDTMVVRGVCVCVQGYFHGPTFPLKYVTLLPYFEKKNNLMSKIRYLCLL